MTANSTIDLHMHSTASDGTDSPDAIVAKALAAGIKVLTLTDHDVTAGADAVSRRFTATRIDAPHRAYEVEFDGRTATFVPGIELSTASGLGKHHVIGLGYALDSKPMRDIVAENLERRRHSLMFKIRIAAERGAVLDEDDLAPVLAQPNAGRPAIAKAIVDKGMAADMRDAFDKYLSNMPVDSDRMYVTPAEAASAIHDAGGIAIWAHPLGGEGDPRFSPAEMSGSFDVMAEAGMDGCECFYSRYGSGESGFLQGKAREFGWLMSAGSDYHGTVKTVGLGVVRCTGTGDAVTEAIRAKDKAALAGFFEADGSFHMDPKDVTVLEALLG